MKQGLVDCRKIEFLSELVAQHLQQATRRGILVSVGDPLSEGMRRGGLVRRAKQLNVRDCRFQLPPGILIQDSVARILKPAKTLDQVVGSDVPLLV